MNTIKGGPWAITEESILEEKIQFYETLFTLGNGYLGSRGVLEEGHKRSYPGTYLAGVYDKSESQSSEIVNLPNPVALEIYIDSTKLSPEKMKILRHRRTLNFKRALLSREAVYEDQETNGYQYQSIRFFSLDDKHIGAIQANFSSIDCDVDVAVRGIIDCGTRNEVQAVSGPIKHYQIVETGSLGKNILYVLVKTRDSGIVIGFAISVCVSIHGTPLQDLSTTNYIEDGISALEASFRAEKAAIYQIDKLISLFTSRDTKRVKEACIEKLNAAQEQGIATLLENHERKWNKLWQYSDIAIEGDETVQKALRFNLYHLLIGSPLMKNIDASIAAKTLSGEWYKGHVFWDTEIYALPFFIYTQPEIARRMLLYRYHRLDKARENAAKQAYAGSLWPWESAATGEDETPDSWVNFDGSRIPVYNKEREHHIAGDVIYAIALYYNVTNDEDFMLRYGAEMLFETARFWASRAVYNKGTKKYEIRNVIGPNEFQESVDNNSYTNFLAGWTLQYAVDIYAALQREHPRKFRGIAQKIGLSDEEVTWWHEIASKIVFFIESGGLIEEFEGYFRKKDVIISEWDNNSMPVWPKGIKLADVKHTQLVKQADVILLLYLFSTEFSDEVKRVNFDYYEKRTTHKSSLSIPSYATLAAQLGEIEKAYKYFIQSVNADIANIYGNTELGIHAASIGGTWQILIGGFAGVSVKDDILRLAPTLPLKWQKLRFRLWFRRALIECVILQNKAEISLVQDRIRDRKGMDIEVYGKRYVLARRKRMEVKKEYVQ